MAFLQLDTAYSHNLVIIYILATLQWANVSFASLLSTFYHYFASDDQKCINYCMHCRKLKCIHYYSCIFRLFTFDYTRGSNCKGFTTYNLCKLVDTPLPNYLITNTVTQFLVGHLPRNLFDRLHMWDTVVWAMGLRETALIRDLLNWQRHRSIICIQSLRVLVMTFMS